MTRTVHFDPVEVAVQGVLVRCANDKIATELLLGIKNQGIPIDGAVKTRKGYCFSAPDAVKKFLLIYNKNETENRK